MEKVQIIVQLVSEGQNSWWRARTWFFGSWFEVLIHFPSGQTCCYEINGQNAGQKEVEGMIKNREQYLLVHGELEIVQSVDNPSMSQEQLKRLIKRPPEIRLEPTIVNLLSPNGADVESDDDVLVSMGTA